MNVDLIKERQNAQVDIKSLQKFIANRFFSSLKQHERIKQLREKVAKSIKSLYEENYHNLDRDQKYELVFKKSLELIEFAGENDIDNYMIFTYLTGEVMGPEKQIFGLHFSMFAISIDLWSTPEQKAYWKDFIQQNPVFGTYIQTEIGHGTYIRGLETTATYDKATQEFVIDSPTLTSIKFWPGGSGKSCNYGILMAKLIVNQKDCGIHAFIVQLRSLETHRPVPGIELGDIGRKIGYDGIDNGYVKFNKLRVPRHHMLARFAHVTPEGEFKRTGSELLMYACMLVMRGTLCMFSSLLLSISTTIAIRYSCVRRQTVGASGQELQIIDYQTQQYRLLPGLATTYAMIFATFNFRDILLDYQTRTDYFKNIDSLDLGKLHSIVSGLKSTVYSELLKFGQLNRLCCGGHGYLASSGLGLILQEADAGCTYEGDNVVLLLQTARFLLKCAQKGTSPHLSMLDERFKSSSVYDKFASLINIYHKIYEGAISETQDRLMSAVRDEGMSPFDAWNHSSVMLTNTAKCFIQLFIIDSNLLALYSHWQNEELRVNQSALEDLFELYLIYGLVDTYSTQVFKYEILTRDEFNSFYQRFTELLKKVRVNAVALVDSFDWSDANLNSALGVYDGQVYEKIMEFAKKSPLNEKPVHPIFEKYLKPYGQKSKL